MNSVLIRFWRRSALPRKFKRVVDKYVLFSRMPVKKRKDHYPSGVPVLAGFLQSGFGIAQATRLEVQALRQGDLNFDLIDLSVAYDIQDLQDLQFISTPCPSLQNSIPVRVVPHPVSKSAGGGLTRSDLGFPASRPIFLAMADGRSDLELKNPAGDCACLSVSLRWPPECHAGTQTASC